jgi:hypothetical protein
MVRHVLTGETLDWPLPQVDRPLAMTHGSKLDRLEPALHAMDNGGA